MKYHFNKPRDIKSTWTYVLFESKDEKCLLYVLKWWG